MTVNPAGFNPFISIVIPTYNRASSTIAAIESALAQTYSNFEIIVVDDGSTDGSGESIQRFVQQRGDGNEICYFRQVNQGPSASRNKGIERARGEYIAFLDSDDVWFPEKLAWQVNALEKFKNECGACFTDARCVDNAGTNTSTFRMFGRRYKEQIGIDRGAVKSLAISFCGFWVSTLLARADILRRIGGFNTDVPFAEDRDLFFRLSLATPLAYVDMPLADSNRSSSPVGSICRPWEKVEVRLTGHQRMYESWLRLDGALPVAVRKTILHNLRATNCDWANLHLESRRYGEARRELSKALTYGFAPKVTFKWALTWIAPAFARKLSAKTKPYL